jgi:hypothetical protein
VTAAEYHQALDALSFGKRLPGALYLLDPGADPRIPSPLRITVAELRRRLEIGPEFNLLKFHTASPKLSFLAKDHPDRPKMARLIRPCLTGSHAYGARRVRSCPNRLQAFGGFQRQATQARSPRGNHWLRAVEGKTGGMEPRAAGKLTSDPAVAKVPSPSWL